MSVQQNKNPKIGRIKDEFKKKKKERKYIFPYVLIT